MTTVEKLSLFLGGLRVVVLVLFSIEDTWRIGSEMKKNAPWATTVVAVLMACFGVVDSRGDVVDVVARGEHWLASQQTTNGAWESSKHVAITAMVLAGWRSHDAKAAESETAVRSRGYDFLLQNSRADGGNKLSELQHVLVTDRFVTAATGGRLSAHSKSLTAHCFLADGFGHQGQASQSAGWRSRLQGGAVHESFIVDQWQSYAKQRQQTR